MRGARGVGGVRGGKGKGKTGQTKGIDLRKVTGKRK